MRLIDADALWMVTEGAHEYYERFEIDQAPTVDAVPVIRCKDCKWYEADDLETYCTRTKMYSLDPNHYCAWAERKEI